MRTVQRVNVYFSGVQDVGIEYDERLLASDTTQYRLLSCHGDYINYAHKCLDAITTSGPGKDFEILLDSGAYTAWSRGAEITLSEITELYDRIMTEYNHKVKKIWMINLDKIPGERGRLASDSEKEDAMEFSIHNCLKLTERFGDRVMPVYHLSEPQRYLLALKKEFRYICVSPRTDVAEKYRVAFTKEAHSHLDDTYHTHGLATTGYRQLRHVPWYSVDSAGWLMTASFGSVILLRGEKFIQLALSSQSGSIRDRGKHFDNQPEHIKKQLQEEVAELGFDIYAMRDDVVERCTFNRIQTIKFATRPQLGGRPISGGLFDL